MNPLLIKNAQPMFLFQKSPWHAAIVIAGMVSIFA
nr:MAG TPA: hypothetical protein [Caudoviricetes sp.]